MCTLLAFTQTESAGTKIFILDHLDLPHRVQTISDTHPMATGGLGQPLHGDQAVGTVGDAPVRVDAHVQQVGEAAGADDVPQLLAGVYPGVGRGDEVLRLDVQPVALVRPGAPRRRW